MLRLITRRHSRWLLPVLIGALVLVSGTAVERLIESRADREARLTTLQQLSTVRARIEGIVSRNVMVVTGLVADLSVEPELGQDGFARHAAALMRANPETRHVAAARDLVVHLLHPMAGNEAAMGLDYRRNDAQLPQVLRARDTRGAVLAGPLELVQGGQALIARAPVFTEDDGRFWGIVSGVIDLDAVWHSSGLYRDTGSMDVAVRGYDGSGASGSAFFGSDDHFAAAAVVLEVTVPGGQWQLAAVPEAGSAAAAEAIALIRWTTAVAVILCVLGVVALQSQVRARERASAAVRSSRERMIDAIESISDGFALWDADDRLVLCNSRYRDLYPELAERLQPGASFEKLLLHSIRTGLFAFDGDPRQWVRERLDPDKRGRRSLELTHRDDRIIRIDERRTAEGGVVGIHTDVTELRRAEEDIRLRAYYDPLTRLPNRARFREQLERAIERARRSGRSMAVLFIDLDRFKNVNDTLGHDVGDELLMSAAGRVTDCLRATDTVARLGGDEFTVLVENLGDVDQATAIAEKIIDALTQPFTLKGHLVYAGASIGITVSPHDSEDADTLLRNADMAMYHAKESGGNACHYFTAEMTKRAQRYVAIETDLRKAIGADQFLVYFQPVVDLRGGQVAGAEALVRWQHPQRGLVMPGEFIHVAEKSGLIVDMGLDVLRTACVEAMGWPGRAARAGVFLSVNVSCRQFKAGLDAPLVAEILSYTGFPAERLVFEITESLLLDEDARVRDALGAFREMGVHLAMDDFGTGYSSLSYLRRFPVTRLKIDRSFVTEMARNSNDARLIQSIVAMSKALAVTPIAEGVETAEQADVLMELGCDLAQGYYFARPMPAADFVEWYSAREVETCITPALSLR